MASNYIRFNSNPILNYLTDNWTTIRDEFFNWAPNIIGSDNPTGNGTKANYISTAQYLNAEVYKGTFKSIPVFMRDTLLDEKEAAASFWPGFHQKGGAKYMLRQERIEAMPTIGKWTLENFNVLGSVQFNICTPGSHLNHHWGLDYKYLRFHLVLKEAAGCMFDIENERHEWKDGELFGFDDSMVLHGTKHSGTEPRTILIFDILKTAVKESAKNWPIRPFVPRKERPRITINEWYN
jgi:hypothetical protein